MKQPLRDILRDKGQRVHSVTPEASLAEAIRLMNSARVGSVVVVVGERPVGIFTERDVLARVVSSGWPLDSTSVARAMSSPLVVANPETTVEEAMYICTEKRLRHLPVVEADRLVGMVSIGDLTRWLVRDQRHRIEDLVSYISGGR